MPDYVVLFPADNEEEWVAGTEADHQRTYDADQEFVQRLRARGGAVTGGAELAHSSKARTITRNPESDVVVVEGLLAKTAEQLSGFILVSCDDYDALVEAAQVLTPAHPVVEIRPLVED